ncbi:MAG: hypothetical protein IKK82_04000 [Kiritimatiellae bacterium]|nr:hypothetical protein [Kiritimatiellia bacterium]
MKRVISIFLLLISGMTVFSADPYAGYIYPSGIQAGTTNRFIVGGQNMWRLRGMHFSRSGLRVLDIKPVPSFTPPTGMQRKHLKNWLDGIAKGVRDEPPKPDDPHISEWRSNSWWRVLGSLDPLEISIVERYLFTPRNPLQDAPSLRQMNIVTIAADSDAEIGVCTSSIWNDGGISAPRPFFVTDHTRVSEPLFMPSHRGEPELPVVDATLSGVVLDGQIMPGETDMFRLRLSGGRRYSVKVTARELQPYVGDAVPGFFNPVVSVKDPSGRVIATADDEARFRPDPLFDFKPPTPDVYTLEIHDVLYRGRADFVYSIEVVPYVPPKPPAIDKEADGNALHFSGAVDKPGAKGICEFTVDRPGKRVLEVTARRKGSPLDAVLTLRRASGDRPLMQWDDTTNKVFVGTVPQGECDPVGEYDFKEPGRYVAEISDRTGHGGEGYFWNLEIRSPTPDFEVYSTRSTLPLYRGRPLKVDFSVVRKEGFTGSVTLEFPKDVKARGNVATSGVDRISVMLTYVGRKPLEMRKVKVSARGKIGGKMVRRDVVPCDEYEQAFAWRHLVPAESFLMRATPGKIPQKLNRKSGRKSVDTKKR